MNALALLGRYFAASMRSQMQYPASAIMLTLGQLGSTAIEIVSIWALFDRFGAVKGLGVRRGDVLLRPDRHQLFLRRLPDPRLRRVRQRLRAHRRL
jgi:ABC-type uncharacterized transport system permease subunit